MFIALSVMLELRSIQPQLNLAKLAGFALASINVCPQNMDLYNFG